MEKKITTKESTDLFAIDKTWWWYNAKTHFEKPDNNEWIKLRFDSFSGGKVDKIIYQ